MNFNLVKHMNTICEQLSDNTNHLLKSVINAIEKTFANSSIIFLSQQNLQQF